MAKIEVQGRYPATVKGAEFGESSTGTPYLKLDHETESGANIASYHYLSDKAFPYTLEMLQKAFEFDGDFERVPEQTIGKLVTLVIEEETDNRGEPQMRVKCVWGPSSAKPIENKGAFLAALTAKAKGGTTEPF